ncbi:MULTISPECIES: YceI family protein [unclassified Streptomyces]|uniref:YceI family protein n=1 Tax=unclassified Streptomyces TaxID=2593676 RepID=UPI00074A36A1|nr:MULTISPECIES: YceI family protein [unclassified Streptomyces]KUL54137.1 hypothetical protein ADL30_16850 [Streptomyces sp. NRRL S-1521]THC55328.1 YceI family protein [Streptomyces sp. A1499]
MERAQTQRQDVPRSGTYTVDTEASAVRFRTRAVFGLFPVRGTFTLARGSVVVAEPAEASTVDAVIRADSFDSGLGRRDDHVRSGDYLDAARHPEIVFRGTGLRRTGGGGVLHGRLTVRGAGAPVDVEITEVVAEGRWLTARGTATVDRYAFGVTKARGMTGRRLQIDLAIRASR